MRCMKHPSTSVRAVARVAAVCVGVLLGSALVPPSQEGAAGTGTGRRADERSIPSRDAQGAHGIVFRSVLR